MVSAERRSFAERRQIQLAMLQGVIMGLVFIPLPYLVSMWLNRPTGTSSEQSFTELTSSASGIIALVIVLIVMVAAGLGIAYVFGELIDRLF